MTGPTPRSPFPTFHLLALFFSLLISVPGPATPARGAEPPETIEKPALTLTQGEQRLIRLENLVRYSLGSEAVRAHRLEKGLLLKGVRPGPSDLWVWKSDGSTEHRSLRVESPEPDALKPGLVRALGSLEEAEILHAGAGVTLRGEVTGLRESARIRAITDAFPKEVIDETALSERLLAEGERKLLEWIRTSPYRSKLRIERRGPSVFVSGSFDKEAERSAVERRIRAIFPAARSDLSALPDDSPTVHFRVFLLELRRNRFRSVGLSWPASQAAAFRVTSGAIQDLLQLDVMLKSLEGEGAGKILSNPELVVRAPGEAELFSGGELPIRSQSHYFSNVSWKNFGLTLKLKVTHSTADRVRLDILSEVSHLDSALADDKVPGLEVNRMKTQVDARYGVPLFLSGLLQQKLHKEAKGLPVLSGIPVLGALFGSEDYQNDRSELVAILLPSITPPEAPMERIFSQPQGPIPPPRDWVSPKEEAALRRDPSFPWNVLGNTPGSAPVNTPESAAERSKP